MINSKRTSEKKNTDKHGNLHTTFGRVSVCPEWKLSRKCLIRWLLYNADQMKKQRKIRFLFQNFEISQTRVKIMVIFWSEKVIKYNKKYWNHCDLWILPRGLPFGSKGIVARRGCCIHGISQHIFKKMIYQKVRHFDVTLKYVDNMSRWCLRPDSHQQQNTKNS